jgi:hypothetical protein
MRRWGVAWLLAVAFLASASSARAENPLRLDWHETAVRGGKPIMEFHVVSYLGRRSGWTVYARFTNTGTRTWPIRKQFGIRIFDNRNPLGDYTSLRARRYAPAMPTRLAPGQSWAGAIKGPRVPIRGKYVRIVFGDFVGRLGGTRWKTWVWITDHAFRMPPDIGAAP